MSKSQTQSKKKRKREKISRSSSEDQHLGQGRKSGSEPDESNELDSTFSEKKSDVKKRKKKKKTKNARDCKGEQASSDTIEHMTKSVSDAYQQQKDSVEETQKLAIQKSKKKKKRKRQDTSSIGFSSSDDPVNNDDSGGSKVGFHVEEDGGDNDVSEIMLEGSMVSGILVLIDRKAGKVYSATEERLENGERKEVGRLNGNGQVVLFRKKGENGTK